MTKTNAPDYQTLQAELEEILQDLQQPGTDVDRAMECYERGLEIIKQLEKRLKVAENTVTKLKADRT